METNTVNSYPKHVNQNEYTLLYDVNADQCECTVELCNTLWFKNGWNKHEKYLNSQLILVFGKNKLITNLVLYH